MSAAESAASAVADQLDKAKAEISAADAQREATIVELRAIITELQSQSVSPETIARLETAAQDLDDFNPDAPPPEPPPEPEPEPAP